MLLSDALAAEALTTLQKKSVLALISYCFFQPATHEACLLVIEKTIELRKMSI